MSGRLALLLTLAIFLVSPLAVARRASIKQVGFRYVSTAAPRVEKGHPVPPPLIPLPPVRQHSASVCGLSCLQSVFAYAGKPSLRGSQLVRRARSGKGGFTYEDGTPEKTMRRLVQGMGLTARSSTRMSLKKLVGYVSSGVPVTVGIQAWVDNPKRVNWRKEQNAGHYVVAIGIGDKKGKRITSTRGLLKRDDAYVWFMDPAMDLGKRGYIPLKEFMARWHWPSESGKGQSRFGLATILDGPPAQAAFVGGVGRIE